MLMKQALIKLTAQAQLLLMHLLGLEIGTLPHVKAPWVRQQGLLTIEVMENTLCLLEDLYLTLNTKQVMLK